jgi:uncharacterized secreted protein with C-terminal beta-propeller domain
LPAAETAAGTAAAPAPATAPAASAADSESGVSAGTSGYSQTNIQVQGIDEADEVKTDGQTLNALSGGKHYLIDLNGGSPKLLSTVSTENFQPPSFISAKTAWRSWL